MMFRRAITIALLTAVAAIGAGAGLSPAQANASMGYAVVPTATIYPGEPISDGQLQEVEVTNPNLKGDYAKSVDEVRGMISRKTLLPGRTISVSALREPYKVTRGSQVRLVFNMGRLTISAAGSPLEDGATGQIVRARNMDSGVIVSGTVLADGTIHVAVK
jgi:flagellar basal body P-ring formation protein FlgA